MFINHYECPRCGTHWTDSWSCQVDDDCPECGLRHISPTESEDAEELGEKPGQETGLRRDQSFARLPPSIGRGRTKARKHEKQKAQFQ